MESRKIGKDLANVGSVGVAGATLPMAMGLNDPVVGGLTVYMLLLISGIILIAGVLLWAMGASKLKDAGKGMTVMGVLFLVVMVVAMAVSPASLAPGEEAGAATFEVLSVSNVGGATFSQSSNTFTVSATVNTTANTISPTQLLADIAVQRTDAGETTDVKTVSASASQAKRTDPTSGLTYPCIASNAYGLPNLDWTMTVGSTSVSATDSLTAQMGLTPFQTGTFNVTFNWNGNAFTTSEVQVSDVIYAATLTIGSEVYTIQVVIGTINT
jgi:hypothetical protein